MPDDQLPPANLILQALHGIRSDLAGTNTRLDTVTGRLDNVTDRLENVADRLENVEQGLDCLGRRTTQGFLKTNTKLAALARIVAQHDRRLHHLLTKGLGEEVRSLRQRSIASSPPAAPSSRQRSRAGDQR